ncbi:MAG: putative oxidoreductase [Acetobacteraceae bacterium]|jgi:putative oxidoreductase|nr:putative oxidoreductase [Acetobacteraceae bacterium]
MSYSEMTDAWAPRLLSVLRIVTGLLFLEHGTQKFFAFPARTSAAPDLASLLGVQGCLEIVGGLLIILGLLTRPVALILAGDMAFAYFISHFPRNFFPALNGGDAAILYCFIFLYLAAAGGGIWSVDASRRG